MSSKSQQERTGVIQRKTVIDKLIINSPYEAPKYYWTKNPITGYFEQKAARRSAGYNAVSPGKKDKGLFVEFIPLERVNTIRERVDAWREAGYPNTTPITRKLLAHWHNREQGVRQFPFFFCQLEALETIIFLTEGPLAERQDLEIPGDGGDFSRWCSKLATGAGKTTVMAMLIAWHTLNHVSYPEDARFSRHFLIVAPGLTVKSRLAVLHPAHEENYYDRFGVIPPGMEDKMNLLRVDIINWHMLAWESEEKIKKRKGVDKRGALSDKAYAHEILKNLGHPKRFVVINDEAHHAWRVPEDEQGKKKNEQSTIWVSGLDRLHRQNGILRCYDLTATPYHSAGKRGGDQLFPWVISDFGINDAIEAGLVKTPRIVVRDNGKLTKDKKSRLYHIYREGDVQADFNRKNVSEEEGLPLLVKEAYSLLSRDWEATYSAWRSQGSQIPPVMITVANRTETCDRIRRAFEKREIPGAHSRLEEDLLQIDSKILEKIENEDNNLTGSRQAQAEQLRQQVDTVGKLGQAGEQICNILSVSMLAEGWDANNVTQIMGLRAFTSQLLCEQVIGRGLRRMSYEVGEDGLLQPEYVNIFGVPFEFLPHEGDVQVTQGAQEAKPRHPIMPLDEKAAFEITWPHIARIDFQPEQENFVFDLDKVPEVQIKPSDHITATYMSPVIDGVTDDTNESILQRINLQRAHSEFRQQKLIYASAAKLFNSQAGLSNLENEDSEEKKIPSTRLFMQFIFLAERFINSEKVVITSKTLNDDPMKRGVLLLLNCDRIVQHLLQHLKIQNREHNTLAFHNPRKPLRSTANAPTWYSTRDTITGRKTHFNAVVLHSGWEGQEAKILDEHPDVKAWAKNDHLDFHIHYRNHKYAVRRYEPDFLVEFTNGHKLILEVKGHAREDFKQKQDALVHWCEVVNQTGEFGHWHYFTSREPSDLHDVLNEIAYREKVEVF